MLKSIKSIHTYCSWPTVSFISVLLHSFAVKRTYLLLKNEFPYNEFYGLYNLSYENDYNIKLQLCDGYTGPKRKGDCCDCRDTCILKKTCCVDHFWNRSRFDNIKDYRKYLMEVSKSGKNAECKNVYPDNGDQFFNHFLVTTCPQETINKDLMDCLNTVESADHFIPVKGDDGYTYQNQYCAKCNHVGEFQFVHLEIKSDYPPSVENFGLINAITYEDELCEPSKDVCAPGNMYYDLCRSFLAPVSEYRNYFCFLCNDTTFEFEFLGYCLLGGHRGPPSFPFTWSTLLQLSDETNSDNSLSCSNRKLDDMLFNKCNTLSCPLGYTVVDSKCKNTNGINNLIGNNEKMFDSCSLRNELLIQIFDTVNMTAENLNHLWGNIIESEGASFDVVYNNDQMTALFVKSVSNTSSLESIIDHMVRKNSNGYRKIIIGSNVYSDDFSLELKYVFPNGRYCANPVKISGENITENCDIITNKNEVFRYQNLSFLHEIDSYSRKRVLYTCNQFYLHSDCQLRKMKSNVSFGNNFWMIHSATDNKTEVFNVNEYIPLKEKEYGVCIGPSVPKNTYWIEDANRAEGVISLVGSLLSILAYFLIFFFLGELQNFSNSSVLSLSICLLVTDGCFFAGNVLYIAKIESNRQLCQFIGILGHFSYTSALIWGAAISFDVFYTVRKLIIQQSQSKMKLYCHVLISFLLSTIIVGSVVVLNHFNIINGSYETDNICALHGFGGRLFFHAIPLGISSIVSIIFFLGSILHIFVEIKRNSEVFGNEIQSVGKLNLLKVGLKLVFITGFAEVVGLFTLYEFSTDDDNELILKTFLSFLYSFLKGFRGVMLFIAYFGDKMMSTIKRKRQANVVKSTNSEQP